MALYQVRANLSFPHLGHDLLAPGMVEELPADDPQVSGCVVNGTLVEASEDGTFPTKAPAYVRRCCGG